MRVKYHVDGVFFLFTFVKFLCGRFWPFFLVFYEIFRKTENEKKKESIFSLCFLFQQQHTIKGKERQRKEKKIAK
jgi:hypothetical protein